MVIIGLLIFISVAIDSIPLCAWPAPVWCRACLLSGVQARVKVFARLGEFGNTLTRLGVAGP